MCIHKIKSKRELCGIEAAAWVNRVRVLSARLAVAIDVNRVRSDNNQETIEHRARAHTRIHTIEGERVEGKQKKQQHQPTQETIQLKIAF